MWNLIRRLVFLGAIAAATAFATTSAAATGYSVTITGASQQAGSFNPATLTIRVNDSVTWYNDSPTVHYVTFAGGTGAAVQNNQPYTRTFTAAGTFPYSCSKHPSMTGTIIVAAPATPPPTAPPPAPTAPVRTLPPVTPPPATLPPTLAPTPAPVVAQVTAAPTSTPTPEPTQAAATDAPDEVVVTAYLIEGDTSTRETAPAPLALPVRADMPPWLALVATAFLLTGAATAWLFLAGPRRLRRYWVEFDFDMTAPRGTQWHSRQWLVDRLGRGCGVTARSEDEALALIRRTLVVGSLLPAVRRVVRDVDPGALPPSVRITAQDPGLYGVWYPASRVAGRARELRTAR